jgi:mono/diheme cytochrome c family protein
LYGAKNPQQNAAAIHYGRVEPIPATAYAQPVVMPPFGNDLTPVQIGELVAYIMTFRAPWPPR